jgi:hypothetical protein
MAKKGFKLPGVSPLKQEGDKFGLPTFDRSGYRSSGGSYSGPQDPSTYFTPGGYFAEGISSFGDMASEYIKNKKPEVNPDGSIGNVGGARTSQTFATNLDKRITAAEAKGDKSKAEKLKGKKQRRGMRDTTQAEINKKKNLEREAKLQERLNEKLTKKGIDPSTVSTSKGSEYKKLFANMASELGVQGSLDTSTDGTALNMKNDSPNKFLGGLTAGIAGGRSGRGGGQVDLQSLAAKGGLGILGRAIRGDYAQQAAGATQAQQAAIASLPGGAAAASSVAGGLMGTAAQNPMTGGLAAAGQAVGGASGGQTLNCTPVAMSYDPPLQANEKGGKKSVFNMNTKGMAEAAFGTPAMRQASVKSPFKVSASQETAFGPDSDLAKENPAKAKKIYDGIKAGDNSPAASTYENPTPVIDHSGGYVAAKAIDTFGNLAGDFITKKYGKEEQ